jgi:hypothetical protein
MAGLIFGGGCSSAPLWGPWNPNNTVGENLRGCVSEGCRDADARDQVSAQDLGGRAIFAARAGDCPCAVALTNASGTKDPSVRMSILHDPRMHSCLDPAIRRAVWAEATRVGTLARCIGDE